MEIIKGALYVTGTPIGNLSDFSERALFVLKNVDFIAAEDTRVTRKLLTHFEIKTPLVSYHEHNRKTRGVEMARRMKAGESCALVSDAGMPAISDPGEEVVRLCRDEGIPVFVIPGPSALIAALSISGFFSGRFSFEGFLSTAKKERRERLCEVKSDRRTLIFYESPHKLTKTLADMKEALGDRKIALCRELTKIHEEVFESTFSGALERYKETPPRGEFVLIIEGCREEKREVSEKEIKKCLAGYLAAGLSKKDAVAAAAEKLGLRKNDVYKFSFE